MGVKQLLRELLDPQVTKVQSTSQDYHPQTTYQAVSEVSGSSVKQTSTSSVRSQPAMSGASNLAACP
eukprot:3797025-Prorocentrum_lima.AAC.1